MLIAAVSIHSVFYINAGAFLLSAVILFFLPKDAFLQKANTPQEKTSALASIKEGLQYLKRMPLLLIGLLTACVVLFVLQIGDSQAIILIRSFSGAPPELAGWCMAVSGAGMLLTAAIAGRRRITSYFLYFSAGTFLLGLATGGVPFLSGMGIAGIALFIFAFFIMGAAFGLVIFHFKFSCKQQCRLITAAGCLAPFRARQPSPPSSAWRAEACWRNGSVFHLLFLSVAAC